MFGTLLGPGQEMADIRKRRGREDRKGERRVGDGRELLRVNIGPRKQGVNRREDRGRRVDEAVNVSILSPGLEDSVSRSSMLMVSPAEDYLPLILGHVHVGRHSASSPGPGR